MQFDINKIMEMIPHRYPFLLIDKIISFTPNQEAVAIKNVTINEEFFLGHFPNKPIMPGVLIIEAMAQTAAVCAIASLGDEYKNKPVYFTGIDSAKFRKPVLPGDTLNIHAKVVKQRSLFWFFECKAFNSTQELATEAKINATIDIRNS